MATFQVEIFFPVEPQTRQASKHAEHIANVKRFIVDGADDWVDAYKQAYDSLCLDPECDEMPLQGENGEPICEVKLIGA